MRLLFFCGVLSAFLLGCSHTREYRQAASRISDITEAERELLLKYTEIRKKVTKFCRLPECATADEVHPHIARFLKLPPNASWEDLLHTPLGRHLFTEERRKELVTVFRLKDDATWIGLYLRVEELRAQLQAAR